MADIQTQQFHNTCLESYCDAHELGTQFSEMRVEVAGFNSACVSVNGARCSIVVKALCYKPEGRGFETRRGECFISLPNPSGLNRPEYQKHKSNVYGE
jgi:hypothetical protein